MVSPQRLATFTSTLLVAYLDYCDTVYITANECELRKLQLIQNTACRTILMVDKRTSVKNMHAMLNLLLLDDRCMIHFKTECFKNISDNNASLSKFFILECDRRERQTRNTVANSMHVLDVRTPVGKKLFSYRGPFTWNQINREMRQSESLQIFKSNLTKEACRDVNHPG